MLDTLNYNGLIGSRGLNDSFLLSAALSFSLSHFSVCLSACLSVCVCLSDSFCLSVCLSVSLSQSLSLSCLSIYITYKIYNKPCLKYMYVWFVKFPQLTSDLCPTNQYTSLVSIHIPLYHRHLLCSWTWLLSSLLYHLTRSTLIIWRSFQ